MSQPAPSSASPIGNRGVIIVITIVIAPISVRVFFGSFFVRHLALLHSNCTCNRTLVFSRSYRHPERDEPVIGIPVCTPPRRGPVTVRPVAHMGQSVQRVDARPRHTCACASRMSLAPRVRHSITNYAEGMTSSHFRHSPRPSPQFRASSARVDVICEAILCSSFLSCIQPSPPVVSMPPLGRLLLEATPLLPNSHAQLGNAVAVHVSSGASASVDSGAISGNLN